MPLSNPVGMYGIQQATIIDRTTKAMFAMLVLGDFDNQNNEPLVPLYGGGSPYPWDVASGHADAKLKMNVKQYDLNALKYLGGSISTSFTENSSGEASGYASGLTNEVGTSISNATTGVASIGIQSGQNPVFGNYLLKAASATTVDVYLDNQLDGVSYVDDTLKITSSPLTVPGTGGNVNIPNTGLKIVGGSGTVAFTTADIASFSARPQNAYNYEYQGGVPGVSKPEFMLRIFTEKLGGNKYRYIEYPRVKANGVSFKNKEKNWSDFETELMVLFDSAKNYAWKVGVTNR